MKHLIALILTICATGATAFDRCTYGLSSRAAQPLVSDVLGGGTGTIVVIGDSTGDETYEWPYLLLRQLAFENPSANVNETRWAGGYQALSVVQSGTADGGTINLYNASIAGSKADRFSNDDFADAVEAVEPDLVIVNYGHNGSSTSIYRQAGYWGGLLRKLSDMHPQASVVILGQNNWTTATGMTPEKTRLKRQISNHLGFDFIDIQKSFAASGIPHNLMMADNVHPNAMGQKVWAKALAEIFCIGSTSNSHPPISVAPIYSASSEADFSNWVVGGAVSSQASDFETDGYALQLNSSNGQNGLATYLAIGAADIERYRGKLVTLSVRTKIPAGSHYSTGRIGFHDGVSGLLSDTGGQWGPGYSHKSIPFLISENASHLRLYIYVNSAAIASEIYIDRVSLFEGPVSGKN